MFGLRHHQLDIMEQVRPLLKSVSGDEFSVPNVIVVGMQSSGKSSVLEHLTGLAFPRGEGMCTRVPTVVSVQGGVTDPTLAISTNPDYSVSWSPPVVYGDTQKFGEVIEALTDRLTQPGEIGEAPIYVKLCAPKAPTFTITDVPGITMNARNLHESERLEKQTTELTKKMIGDSPDTLVLVVVSATEDFTTSKALQLARTLDPKGERTIGVVTKIDNLPEGSDLVKNMSGELIHLKHGFFAVRNRSQKEIDEDLDIAELDLLEEELFRSHPVLKHLPAEQQGMPRLLDKVKTEQAKRLDRCIPVLREKIKLRRVQEVRALSHLPESLGSEEERTRFLRRALGRIAADFRGCTKSDTSVLGTTCLETNLSARVNDLVNKMAGDLRTEQRDFLNDETKDELRAGAKESLGYDLCNFMCGDLFRSTFAASTGPLLNEHGIGAICHVQTAVQKCFDLIVDRHVGEDVLPALNTGLKDLFSDLLCKIHADVLVFVSRLIHGETNVTYTVNHYYIQTIEKFKEIVRCNSKQWVDHPGQHPNGVVDGKGVDVPEDFMRRVVLSFRNNSNDAEAIRGLQISLYAYSKVVQKRFADSVAVVLINELVFGAERMLTDESLAWTSLLVEKVKEDPDVSTKRARINKNIQALDKALELLKSL